MATKTLGLIARIAVQRAPCRARRRVPQLAQPRSLHTSTMRLFPENPGNVDDAEEERLPAQFYESDGLGMDDEMERLDSAEEEELFETQFGMRDDDQEPRWPPSFFSMDEERDDPGEDPEFENDDITSTAHGELEQHRELREFARVMAWDMPLLFNHAKAFEPPTAAQPLRFRYTTYLGENHPAARKVVLTFSPSALPNLTAIQTSKLIKLLGVRYNPSTESAKLSCELYPTTAQNKRYLGDLLEKLLVESRDDKDTFEDVPFDFRHHRPKKRYVFPEGWKLTEERKRELEARRVEMKELEEGRGSRGELVEGTKLIEEMLRPQAESEREAVMQMATVAEQKSKPQRRRPTNLR